MPTLVKQDYQDDEPNDQRQSGKRYCEYEKQDAEAHLIHQETEIETHNYTWMGVAFIEGTAEGRCEQHRKQRRRQRQGTEQQYHCQCPDHPPH